AASCARKIDEPLTIYRRLGFSVDDMSSFVQCMDGFLRKSSGRVGREVEQKIAVPLPAVSILFGNFLCALRCKSGPPEPAIHRRHGLVRWTRRDPRLHWQVIGFAFELHVRVVAFRG